MVHTEIQHVSPAMAGEYLKRNTSNRDLLPNNVKRFEEQLRTGAFILTHQGIAFDKSGRLADGQHRLHAIVNTGITAPMSVTFGLDEAAFAVMDQGVKRSAANILNCDKKVSELVTLAMRITENTKNTTLASHIDLQAMFTKVGPAAQELLESCSQTASYFSSAPVRLGAVIRVLAGDDKEYVHDLYAKLVRAEISELPNIASVWMTQHIKKRIKGNERMDALARALYCFDKTKRNSGRIRELDENETRSYVREVIQSI
jgi:hypothetical protein